MSRMNLASAAALLFAAIVPWECGLQRAKAQDAKGSTAQGKTVEVATQWLISRKHTVLDPFGRPETRPTADEEFLASQQFIIPSWFIASKAAQKLEGKKLRSFKDLDRHSIIRAITSGLSVRRPLGRGNVFDVAFHGADASDGAEVLQTLLDVYQNYLTLVTQDEHDRTVQLMTEALDRMQQIAAAQDEHYAKFRLKAPPGGRDSDEIRSVLSTAAAKRAALLIARKEIEGRLAWIEKAIADPQARTTVLVKINEWSARSGFDKLPAPVKQEADMQQVYRDYLKQELEENSAVERSLADLVNTERDKLYTVSEHESVRERLRTTAENGNKLRDAVRAKLNEFDLFRASAGYQVQVVSPPMPTTPR
jgi:hypothetical protein